MIKNKLFILILSSALIMGCGGSHVAEPYETNAIQVDSYAGSPAEYKMAAMDYEAAPELAQVDGSVSYTSNTTSAEPISTNRKFIKNADLQYETKNFDAAYQALLDNINQQNGYIENNSMSQNGYSVYEDSEFQNRTAYITARIPCDNVDAFIGTQNENLKLTNKQETTRDVTLQFTDNEARIRALETERETIEGMLKQATTVDELIQIQDRLSNINYELDYTKSSQKLLQSQIDYSTVNISLSEVYEYTEPEKDPYFVRIVKGFKENLKDTGYWITDRIEWIITHLPSITLFVIIAGIAFKFIRFIRKKLHIPLKFKNFKKKED